jgi:large subunit ribosomal protein L1
MSGKKYKNVVGKVDIEKKYPIDEAVQLLTELKTAKFDETVDVAVRLGIDAKQTDQMVRGAVSLPNGLGRKIRVVALVKGEKEKEATEAGADFVGNDELIQKIQEGWFDFDKVVATPDMMASVSKLGKVLGPRGLMPNPKVGTVTPEIGKAVKELKAGKVEFRNEKAGIVHVPVGKISFGAEKLKTNIVSLIEGLMKAKPNSSKGVYLRGVSLSCTMSPGIRVDLNSLAL